MSRGEKRARERKGKGKTEKKWKGEKEKRMREKGRMNGMNGSERGA